MTHIVDGSSFDYSTRFDYPGLLYSWGWLGTRVPAGVWVEGKKIFLARLKELPPSNFFCGYHDCGVCDERDISNGSLYVEHKGVLFHCPAGVGHYVKDHDYCPPRVVIDAVIEGTATNGDRISVALMKKHKDGVKRRYDGLTRR